MVEARPGGVKATGQFWKGQDQNLVGHGNWRLKKFSAIKCCTLGYKAIGLCIVFSTEALAEEVHRLSK